MSQLLSIDCLLPQLKFKNFAFLCKDGYFLLLNWELIFYFKDRLQLPFISPQLIFQDIAFNTKLFCHTSYHPSFDLALLQRFFKLFNHNFSLLFLSLFLTNFNTFFGFPVFLIHFNKWLQLLSLQFPKLYLLNILFVLGFMLHFNHFVILQIILVRLAYLSHLFEFHCL